MNAIISNGDYTTSVQLPVERKQLAGALSYLGKNHASAYDIKYNEESDQGLSFTLDCRDVVENAIAKAIPTGFRFHTFNDTIALMHNLPYQSRREFENTVKVEGLASYEQLDRMLSEAYPQSVTTKYYCPLTIQVHGTNSWGEVDEDGYKDAQGNTQYEDVFHPVTKEAREALVKHVIDGYTHALEQAQTASQAPVLYGASCTEGLL